MRSPDPSIRAEELFNRWLSESREDASLDLDEWAAGESADVLAELRRRVEELSSLRRLVGGTLLTLSPGQRFGDFELKRELGRGGMGVVWQARDTRVQRDVALKFLEPGSLLSNEKFARFEREAQASGKLMHEGIVRLLSVGEAAETHYLVLELVPRGRTLADWNRHVHSESMERDHYLTVARLFERVCTALEYAHSQGVIHRDIKPQNILLDPQDVPKVTDFGLARIEDALALTKTGNTPGTCYYMSPEQAGRAKSLVDHRTDIFSLGVTLYETLTARRPFEGTTEFEVLEHIRRVRPVHPQQLDSSIPRQLATLCLKAIEKHPADRFATMAELAADLDRFARGVPIQTQPPGPIERAVKWARRKPVLAASSALLFVALSTVAWLAFTLGAERSVFASATRFDHVDEIAEMLDDGDVDGARKRYDQVPGDLRELWSMRHFWALITNGATFEPGPPLWAGALARDTDAVLLAPESGALQWDLGPDRIVAAPPSALAITPNGRRVLTLESQTIRWALVGEGWSDARWQPEGPVKSVALHPTTDAYAWIEDNGAFTVANWGGEGKLLTLTTIDEDEDEDEDDHPTGATQVAFNASGTRVAWCGPKSLRVFKQGSRGELQSVYRWENPETKSDKAPIHAFAVLGDGSQCLTLQSTGRLRLFGELPGAVTRVFHSGVAGGRMYVETSLSVLADREDLGRLTCLAAVSERDPFYVGTAQGNVLSIDLQVGNRLGLRRTYSSSANDVLDVVLRGSQLVALCEDGTRVTWDAYARAAEGALDPLLTEDSGELQQLLRCGYALPRTVFPDYMPLGPLRSAEQIAVHPTGQAAACIDRAGRWRVGTPPFNATEDIDVKPGTPGRPSRRLTWARGARRLAYIDSENRVQVMDVDSGVTSSSEPLAGEVEVLALDQGGRRVAAGMRDGSVQVWQPAAQQDANAHSQPDSTWSDWHSQGQRISALFWTEAGQLWVADRSGAVASLADADTRLGGWQLASDEIGHLCVTPDGKTFAIATDLEVQLFELDVVESGKLKASFTRELKPTVLALTFTNEEDLLAFTETGEGLAYRVRAAHTGSEMQVEEQLAGLARQLRNEFVFTEAIRAHLNGREDLTTDERQQLTLMVERQPDRDLRDVVEDVHRITNSRMEYPARYGWALRHARAAVSILPEHRAPASNSSEDRSASFALAAALFRTGAYEESLSTFEATLARNASVMDSNSEAGAYAVAALCARELERGDPAAAYFARAQALIPTDRTRNAYVLEARRAFEE